MQFCAVVVALVIFVLLLPAFDSPVICVYFGIHHITFCYIPFVICPRMFEVCPKCIFVVCIALL